MRTIRTKKAGGSKLYSEGILSGGFVFTGGKVGMDPETSEVRKGIKEQTEQALENIKSVLEAGGSSIENVVRMTIFLTDMSDYDKMNEVYKKYVGKNPPARYCVGVSELAKPELKVEIDAIAEVK